MYLQKRTEYGITDKSFNSINCLYGNEEPYNVYLHLVLNVKFVHDKMNVMNVNTHNVIEHQKKLEPLIKTKAVDYVKYQYQSTGVDYINYQYAGIELTLAFHTYDDCNGFMTDLNELIEKTDFIIKEYIISNKKKNITKLFEHSNKCVV